MKNYDIFIFSNDIALANNRLTDNAIRILQILNKYNKLVCSYSSIYKWNTSPNLQRDQVKHYIHKEFDFLQINTSKNFGKVLLKKYESKFNRQSDLYNIILIGSTIGDYKFAQKNRFDFVAISLEWDMEKKFIDVGFNKNDIYPSLNDLFDPSGHGVVVLITNKNNEILLVKEGRKNNKYYNHWSGPHGRCIRDDILEEETVVRETFEETNLHVKPIKKYCTKKADSKIKTVSFWKANTDLANTNKILTPNNEISSIKWIPLSDILKNKYQLYPGTISFFNEYKNLL